MTILVGDHVKRGNRAQIVDNFVKMVIVTLVLLMIAS